MTSASGGRNRVAHHCKVDWCHLVKTLEYQQTHLVLQTLLNGQPVQSISDVAGDVVVHPFVQYQSSRCIQHVCDVLVAFDVVLVTVIVISSLLLYSRFFYILSLCLHPSLSVLSCPFECNIATIICHIM